MINDVTLILARRYGGGVKAEKLKLEAMKMRLAPSNHN